MPSATILLVEDDQSLLDGISDLLEVVDLGYNLSVLTASNGQNGLSILAHHTPDLVISDIMMPTMGGYEFLEHLRNNSAWVHIPVIFLSARGTKEDIRAGRVSGAEMYITKPFDNDELLEMVKSQLDRAFELQSDRARRLDKLQHNIIQLLNHEFRTPLTYVTAYYEMLADGLSNQNIEFVREYLLGIQVGAVRMSKLIDNFVRVIELRTGEAKENYEQRAGPIDNLSETFQSLCQEWQENNKTPVTIQCAIPTDLPPVFGNRNLLCEALDRLIDNAVKFTLSKRHSDPEVIITAGLHYGRDLRRQSKEIYITIQDNGIGFPLHVQTQIFDLFFQYNREQMEQQGSGSGLTVAKGLVELQNGRIQVESQVGQGSTFTIFLPIYDETKSVPSPDVEKPMVSNKPATILLVEDEWYLLDGLRELLEIFECDYNLRVITASNGIEALEKLEQHQPDLIITDIMMPKMDGYQFLANVRENPALLHIPVILLTARGERRDILRGRSSGAEEYIVKPYDSDELLELVIKQLDRHFQMQSAIRQSFDELKRGILNLLQPDFRNPLASVSDYSQRLETSLENVRTEEEMRDSLKGIQSASRRITKMVEDFIFLAEIRTGEAVGSFELVARPTNASMILMEACDIVKAEAKQRNVTIRRKVDMNLPNALVDYDRLKSGIQRLISLLIDYCFENDQGSVLVGSLVKNDFVHLVFGIDTLSFSKEKVEQINHLFAREDVNDLELSEHDPDLVIIKGIIVLHGGHIRIDNLPGRSARFIISLPVYQPAFEFDQD